MGFNLEYHELVTLRLGGKAGFDYGDSTNVLGSDARAFCRSHNSSILERGPFVLETCMYHGYLGKSQKQFWQKEALFAVEIAEMLGFEKYSVEKIPRDSRG